MDDNKEKLNYEPCKFNIGVECKDGVNNPIRCSWCGWNPEIEARRRIRTDPIVKAVLGKE